MFVKVHVCILKLKEVQPDILVNGEKLQIVPEFKYLIKLLFKLF